MYLQNNQENGGGAPTASSMPKSDQGISRVKETIFFFSQESHIFFVMIPPSFMEEEDALLSMESRSFPSK